jgi:hypothetical protein
MSIIWDSLIELQNNLISQLEASGTEVYESGMERFNQPGWVNRVWSSDNYRRAHVDVVDMREQKKLWMMHVCVFPDVDNDGPIYGFDVIAGPNKMTGAFHDFSATANMEHHMIDHFAGVASSLKWKRERELPNWAKEIFTDHMIAAGMVKEQEEIDQICKVARENMRYYLRNIGNYNGYADNMIGRAAQNNYAYYQKQNPHTPTVMKSLGLNEDDVDAFINESLFPEI